MTADHLLQVNGRFVKAESVQEGDTVQVGGSTNGPTTKITKTRSVTREDGVYAPLTPSGTIVVDNLVASTYISLQQDGNEYPKLANGIQVPISQQFGIHMLLSPYRMLCMGLHMDGLCHSMNEEGMSSFVDWGIKLAKYADTLNVGLQLVLLVVALVLIVPAFVLETIFGARYSPLVVFIGVAALQKWKQRSWDAPKRKNL